MTRASQFLRNPYHKNTSVGACAYYYYNIVVYLNERAGIPLAYSFCTRTFSVVKLRIRIHKPRTFVSLGLLLYIVIILVLHKCVCVLSRRSRVVFSSSYDIVYVMYNNNNIILYTHTMIIKKKNKKTAKHNKWCIFTLMLRAETRDSLFLPLSIALCLPNTDRVSVAVFFSVYII